RPKLVGPDELCYPISESQDYHYKPSFHWQEELEWWLAVDKCVRENYHDGRPLHLSKPELSAIKTLDKAEYEALSQMQINKILRTQSILVRGPASHSAKFDRSGLKKLGNVNRAMTIQDFSIRVKNSARNLNTRYTRGTPLDLLRANDAEFPKALNGLDFPLTSDPFGVLPYSSDGHAWRETVTLSSCRREEQIPVTDIRWGLASTAGTVHRFHADSEGMGTSIRLKCGTKLWLVLTPKGEGRRIAETTVFTIGFDPQLPDPKLWSYECIVLQPGSEFIMRPCTPHAVLTPEPTICHGAHYYCMSTIGDSVMGIYHTFIAHSWITNAQHTLAAQKLMARMLIYAYENMPYPEKVDDDDKAHLPRLETFADLLDLLTFCNFFELQNLLAPWMYKSGEVTHLLERKRSAHTRALARRLVHWVLENYVVSDSDGVAFDVTQAHEQLHHRHLACQARALSVYKTHAYKEGIKADDGLTPRRLDEAIGRLLSKGSYEAAYRVAKEEKITTFAWTGPEYKL
ncbi:hypothetical protein FPV67DRAFT_1357594, partial [Lyophyllum atratum]